MSDERRQARIAGALYTIVAVTAPVGVKLARQMLVLGLIPIPFEQALNGQEGITTETLGGADENSITQNGTSTPLPESQGGYDPGVQSCYDIWKATNAPPKGMCGSSFTGWSLTWTMPAVSRRASCSPRCGSPVRIAADSA